MKALLTPAEGVALELAWRTACGSDAAIHFVSDPFVTVEARDLLNLLAFHQKALDELGWP